MFPNGRLFQKIYQHILERDIILGDRGCCSYAEMATLLLDRHVDSVFRCNATKKVDFRRGRWLGYYDHIDTWKKPNHKVVWMTQEEYNQLPNTLQVREIRYSIDTPGFRTRKVTVITTLLDVDLYSKEDLADLYRQRWDAEVNIRHLKSTMNMEFINSKTPSMVRKQVWVHLLAYNLIRRLMFKVGELHNIKPLRISFKGTIDIVIVYIPKLVVASTHFDLLYARFLWAIAERRIPYRPNRYEPRRIKRRKNPAFSLLSAPRSHYRQKVGL